MRFGIDIVPSRSNGNLLVVFIVKQELEHGIVGVIMVAAFGGLVPAGEDDANHMFSFPKYPIGLRFEF